MSRHSAVPGLQAAASQGLCISALLDHCRRLAGTRLTGDPGPADEALSALRETLPREDAYRLFGLLHDLMAMVDRTGERPFLWHPSGARRRSEDETWLAEHALAALSTDRRTQGSLGTESVIPLAESYCAAAERSCGLHEAAGEPCASGCPFEAGRVGGKRQPLA